MSKNKIVKQLVQGEDVPLSQVLEVLDHPLFLLDNDDEVDGPSLEELQRFNRIARDTLISRGLLDSAREALFPLADQDKDSRDCRECRVLCNLLVPENEQPNPEWVGAVA